MVWGPAFDQVPFVFIEVFEDMRAHLGFDACLRILRPKRLILSDILEAPAPNMAMHTQTPARTVND